MLKIETRIPKKDLEYIKSLQTVSVEVKKANRRFLRRVIMYLHRQTVAKTPIGAFQLLRGSIFTKITGVPKIMTGIVATSSVYGAPVEFGTRPHMPPIDPIEIWVRRKLKVDEKESRKVAKRIAWKIKHKGTKGAHMFARAFNRSKFYIKMQTKLLEKEIIGIIEKGKK